MKLAIVDLSFHWPPRGGSWVEVAEVVKRLPGRGVEVVVVVPRLRTGEMERGLLSEDPGFRVVPVPIAPHQFHWRRLPSLLAQALRREEVDRVWLTNAFNLAPSVIRGLAGWPTVWRVFGYELLCPNYMSLHPHATIARWAEENPSGEICPRNFFESPLFCTVCSVRGMRSALLPGRRNSYSQEWVASRAWLPRYVARARRAVRTCLGVMVYNDLARARFLEAAVRVKTVPGGVDTERFAPSGCTADDIVLMAGRADDPRKGITVFSRAVSLLRGGGWEGTALATTARTGEIAPGVLGTGWIPYGEMAHWYRRARVVVVPTLWPEPFGLVALEAMGCGRPVVASAIGGLTGTVGKTGLLFPPGDAESLRRLLERLLAGRSYWESKAQEALAIAEEYSWDRVVERNHLPLLAGSASSWE